MSNIYFCSFASSDMKRSLNRIGKQADSMGIFTKNFLYTEKQLPEYAQKRCNDIINATGTRRGYAYWSWKPVIVNEVLSKVNNGDIVFYSDAGSHINPRGKKMFLDIIEQAKLHNIWAIKLSGGLTNLKYTKADTIEYFNKLYNSSGLSEKFNDVLIDGQIEAGTFVLIKNDKTVQIMKQFESLMSLENLHYFDDSVSEKNEDPDFVTHRHDQSVFSLLLNMNDYAYGDIQDFWAADNEGWNKLRSYSPILRLRDKDNSCAVIRFLKKCKSKLRQIIKK